MDKLAAANKINEFLQAVVKHGSLHLKYRIVVDPPLADQRDWEQEEIWKTASRGTGLDSLMKWSASCAAFPARVN